MAAARNDPSCCTHCLPHLRPGSPGGGQQMEVNPRLCRWHPEQELGLRLRTPSRVGEGPLPLSDYSLLLLLCQLLNTAEQGRPLAFRKLEWGPQVISPSPTPTTCSASGRLQEGGSLCVSPVPVGRTWLPRCHMAGPRTYVCPLYLR